MKKARVYIDTSVIGGCFDPEFEKWSRGLFLNFEKGVYQPVVSELVEAEISHAPQVIQEFLLDFVKKYPAVLVSCI